VSYIALLESLSQHFIDHYYPAMERHGKVRDKKDRRDILSNIADVFDKGGVPRLMKAITRNYTRHLGEELGGREAQDFILSVKELLAELALTEG
jgi:hypothetical protein